MEAKDTVKDGWKEVKVKSVLWGSRWGHVDITPELQAQAEISFKAGLKLGEVRQDFDEIFTLGRKAGIREVAEGVLSIIDCPKKSKYRISEIYAYCEAKLKEWASI